MYKATQAWIALLLAILTVFATACSSPTTDGTTSTTTNSQGTTSTTTTGGTEDPPAPTEATVCVVNGTLENGSSSAVIHGKEALKLTANTAPRGFVFSHWENAAGQTVSEESCFFITTDTSNTYKAYYTVAFGNAEATPILTDATDWMQGGYNGTYTSFSSGNTTRVITKEPLYLPRGSVLSVQLPTVECLLCPGDCPSLEGEGDCRLVAGIAVIDPPSVAFNGAWYNNYTVRTYKWGSTFTATEDCYVAILLKWDQHGGEANSFLLSSNCFKETTVTLATPSPNMPVAPYWEDEVADALSKILANRQAIGAGVSEFFYLTDAHWEENAQYSPALINYMAELLEAYRVVFGGDVIRRYNASKDAAMEQEINQFFNALTQYTKSGEQLQILVTLGNHDRNGSSGQPDANERLTEQEAYDAYLARLERFGVTVKGNPNQGYFDDVQNKVRYVQFYFAGGNSGLAEDAYVDAALAWAEQKILELDEGWTVVLFSHSVYWGYDNSGNEFTARNREIIGRVLSLQGRAKATIAAWITGHVHEDHFEIVGDGDGNKLLLLSLNCDAYGNSNSPNGLKMTPGTVTEQSFSFIQIDPQNEILYLTRVGAGADYTFCFGSKLGTPTEVFFENASVKVINGLTSEGKTTSTAAPGETVTLTATAIAGYTFSHWVDATGATVGTTETVTVTVGTKANTYQAIYSDTSPENTKTPVAHQVLTGVANDWQQGGYDGQFKEWSEGALDTRVTFAKPYLLKKGETLTVSYPQIATSLAKCYNQKSPCSDGCKLAVAIVVLEKIEGKDTGDLFTDYKVLSSSWKTGGTATYTATRDVYVVCMIKFHAHGGEAFTLSFPEMQSVVVTVTPKED